MAALRYTARTLGRFALRRPQGFNISSTVAEHQRGFLPRLINTNGLTVEQQKDVASRLVQIDVKKEELYNLISGLERNYNLRGKIVQQNGQLACHLAVLVKPKPNDPYWLLHSRSQRVMNCIRFMGGCCLGPLIVSGLVWWMTEAHPEGEEDSLG